MEMNLEGTEVVYITISHKGATIDFPAPKLKRTAIVEVAQTYKLVNAYLATLSAAEQDQAFSLYVDIKCMLERTDTFMEVIDKLKKPVAELLDDCFHTDVATAWVIHAHQQGLIQFPKDLPEVYARAPGMAGSIEQTYLKQDYIALLTFTLHWKLLAPIVGLYISVAQGQIHKDSMDFMAFSIVDGSSINGGPVIDKLRAYIEAMVDPESVGVISFSMGINVAQFPYYLIAKIATTRLWVAELSATTTVDGVNKSIITNLYGAVRQPPKSISHTGASAVTVTKGIGREDVADRPVALDAHGSHSRHSVGEEVAVEYGVRNIHACVSQMNQAGMRVSMTNVEKQIAIATAQLSNPTIVFSEVQKAVAKWVCKPIILPHTWEALSRVSMLNMLAIAHAFLAENNFMLFAGLVTSKHVSTGQLASQETNDAKAKIDTKLVEQLNIVFPYQFLKPGSRTVYQNPVVATVFEFVRYINATTHELTVPEAELANYNSGRNTRILQIPATLGNQIAHLCLTLGQMENARCQVS